MSDAERMEKRLAILKQVDRILKLCHCQNTHLKQTCEHCLKLRPLGEQLLKLTKPRMDITTSGQIVPFKKKVEKPIEKPSFSIAVEDYVQAKLNKMSDVEFYKEMNVSHHFFRYWKKRNMNEINRLKDKLKVK